MRLTFPYQETWLHRVNPSIKLLYILALFIVALMIHNLDVLMYFTIFVLMLLVLWSGHPWKRLLLYCSPFILIFIGTSTSMIFFGKGDTTWFKWGPYHITEESFFRGIHLGFRALLFAGIGLMFALTTRPVLLFYSLMQQWKLPPKYAYSFMAGIRMLPILFEEFGTLRYAIKVRGGFVEKGFRGFLAKLKFYSIPLLAQSIRRAQRIAVAMEAKRFTNLRQRTYFYHLRYSFYDVLLLLYLLCAFIVALILGEQSPFFGIQDVRYYE